MIQRSGFSFVRWPVGACVRRALMAVAASVAVACTPLPDSARDQSQPIGATTRFDALEFEGTWILVAAFEPLREGQLSFMVLPEASGIALATNVVPGIAGVYREGAPGELIPRKGDQEALVVMWVDEGYRTAVIGTPSGTFGAILNRNPALPPDRDAAAREILKFYGWDVSRLQRTFR